MPKLSKLLFAGILVFLDLLFPTYVQLFELPQASIMLVYFIYLYLCYSAYANVNTMTISKYDTKGDLCFDFMMKQGLFCLGYIFVLTVAGLLFLFTKETSSTTVADVLMFFFASFINLILFGIVLLLLRVLYGTVTAFVSVGLYIGLSAFLSMFLGELTDLSDLPNPFITIYAYGEPLGIGAFFGYLFVLAVIIALWILFKKKDMKV